MLIRTYLVADAGHQARLGLLLDLPDVFFVGASASRALWDELGSRTVDLVLVQEGALASSMRSVVERLRTLEDGPEVVVLAEREDPESRAELLSAGCAAVLYAGLSDEALRGAIAAVVARRRVARAQERPRGGSPTTLDDLDSVSPAMRALLATARRVAASDASLLVLGETGAGKEHLARAIHASGSRRAGPFVAINCGAIPEALLESELFGHERGAFTGAVRARRGLIELAHRGTLFLDEIADLPLPSQVKLLRVLQDHKVQPVGAEHAITVDVRVVAATSKNLELAIQQHAFRADLFYRLSVVSLEVPPLRERAGDIPGLADGYREYFSTRLGRRVGSLSRDALDILARYPWPGNVRELANVMERAVLLCPGEVIGASDLGELARHREDGFGRSLDKAVSATMSSWTEMTWHEARDRAVFELERAYLTAVLRATHGHLAEAARRSGLNPRSLYEKMHKHGLRRAMFRGDDGSGP